MGARRGGAGFGAIFLLALAGWPPGSPAGAPLSLTVKSPDGATLSDVVVYMPGVSSPVPGQPIVIDQRDQTFVPRITVVQTGSEVLFTNSDTTSHHVYSFSKPNSFELPLYKGNGRLPVRLGKAGVVVLGCNIHDSMLGYVVVVDSGRAGVTDRAGAITLPDIPAGRHEILAWAPGLDATQPHSLGIVEVGGASAGPQVLTLNAKVRSSAVAARNSLAGGDY